jgi:hypothetical protein
MVNVVTLMRIKLKKILLRGIDAFLKTALYTAKGFCHTNGPIYIRDDYISDELGRGCLLQ